MVDNWDLFWNYGVGSIEMLAGFCFFTGFLQKKVKPIYPVGFTVFGMAVLSALGFEGIWDLAAFLILLVAAGRLLYRADWLLAVLYAVVTIEIMNLCFGLSVSLSYILFPLVFAKNPGMMGFLFAGAGTVFALLLAVLCYRVIQRCCAWNENVGRKYVFLILMPALLIFLASAYINETLYGNTVTIGKDGLVSDVNPYQMLLIQALGMGSLFGILFSEKKLAESFRRNQEAALLGQQADFLNQYVEEAKLRYEKTTSFRHDIKNHITVLKELLQNEKTEAALQYVEGMGNITADLSFPVNTNHPVLDLLLGNKLGLAEENQIQVQCSLIVPYPCGISDIDFCIILGNALDNAISACSRVKSGAQKYIHVTGKVQGDFLLMEIENSCMGGRMVRPGIGLTNIRTAVEKYHGAVEIRAEEERFVLSILLILPRQIESGIHT